MSEDAQERCPDCGGLGATVEEYLVVDEDGYEFMAWKNTPCVSCGATGRI